MGGSKTKAALAAGIMLALSWSAVAALAQDKEAIIKERRATMKAQGEALQKIADYAKGAGDEAAAQTGIDELMQLNAKIVGLFAEGTSEADFPGKTGAKPAIWADWEKFKTIPPILAAEEQKMAQVIKTGDRQAVGQQISQLGKNGCGTCHTPFRTKLP